MRCLYVTLPARALNCDCLLAPLSVQSSAIKAAIISGWVETEQRVWLRRKWTRQFASLDAGGLLRISSPSAYDKQQFFLCNAQAVFISGEVSFLVHLDPSLSPSRLCLVCR